MNGNIELRSNMRSHKVEQIFEYPFFATLRYILTCARLYPVLGLRKLRKNSRGDLRINGNHENIHVHVGRIKCDQTVDDKSIAK